jgi:hypothetical protein
MPRDTQFLAHPSVGGSRGYDIHTREMMVELRESGNPVPQTMIPAYDNGRGTFCLTG